MKNFLHTAILLILCFAATAQTTIQMPLPPQSSTFGNNVRGYWFTAPTCFTITGLEVPTDASTGNQSIAVLRLYAPPPVFASNTNSFTTLFLVQDSANPGMFPVNIQVEQGDIIGVLGFRGSMNSYGATNFVSDINGFPVTLARFGMQYDLATTSPQEVWEEPSGSYISRVWLYYDSLITYNITHNSISTLTEQFLSGADSSFTIVWDYGDISPLDTAWNPTHTYAAAGTYIVCCYITNSCGTDTLCTSVTVGCTAPLPVANFISAVNIDTVSFTDNSANTVSWFWDFGDGDTSTSQNPVHVYDSSGVFNVCLIAENICGQTDTFCIQITVCIPVVALFTSAIQAGGVVQFTDSSAYADSWSWDFGDLSTGSGQSPQHTYLTNGTYYVCLYASSFCAADTFCDSITVCPEALTSNFTYTNIGPNYTFTNSSSGASSYFWDFGDGNNSSSSSPSHTFGNGGTYVVCLTAYNICGDSVVFCDSVLVQVAGIYEADGKTIIQLMPNPVSDVALLEVSSAHHSGHYLFELFDMRGTVITTMHGIFNRQLVIRKGNISAGVYYFRIKKDLSVIGIGKFVAE